MHSARHLTAELATRLPFIPTVPERPARILARNRDRSSRTECQWRRRGRGHGPLVPLAAKIGTYSDAFRANLRSGPIRCPSGGRAAPDPSIRPGPPRRRARSRGRPKDYSGRPLAPEEGPAPGRSDNAIRPRAVWGSPPDRAAHWAGHTGGSQPTAIPDRTR
jgi:hypothetical protein